MSVPRVGFVGLGNMGGRMAARITEQAVPVLGYDPVTSNVEEAGATVTSSPADVARGSDVVLMSLPDSTVVEAVVRGPDGLASATRSGQVVVDLSTSSPDSTRSIAAQLVELGVSYLDAGISGGAAAADQGALTLMVGGDPDALETVRPLLDLFSAQVHHMGPSGAGHTTKLLNNFLNAVSLAATAEVMVAGRKAGLDLDTLLDVINASSGVNFASLNRFPRIIHGDYLEGGLTNDLMMKDVLLYSDLLAKLGVVGVNASGPMASFGAAIRLGYADQISNRVVDALGDLSGGVRLSGPSEAREGNTA